MNAANLEAKHKSPKPSRTRTRKPKKRNFDELEEDDEPDDPILGPGEEQK